MNVSQIYNLVNQALAETTGIETVLNEDLSNLVTVGDEIFNAQAVDNYGRSLVNVIGRTIFVNRAYRGKLAFLRRDGWEFGSVLRKIRVVPAEATENETWELRKGASYDPNIFNPAETHEKFFNKRTTFEVDISITEYQLKESFQGVEQLNSFIGMIEQMILNVIEKAVENMSFRAVNNMIAETIYDDYKGADLSSKTGVKAVNLLKKYNDLYGADLTPEIAIVTPEFIRYATYVINEYVSYMTSWSKLFNIEKTDKHTPRDRMRLIMLSKLTSGSTAFLQSGTFNDEYVKLPTDVPSEVVPYWQGSGEDFGFESVSKIHCTTATGHEVEASGILACMFDEEAIMICNDRRRTTTGYNPRGEFFNYFHKNDCEYLNDLAENMVVFFVA